MPTTNFAIIACYNLDNHQAQNDELKGTLLGHIDYVDEALDNKRGTQLKQIAERRLRAIMWQQVAEVTGGMIALMRNEFRIGAYLKKRFRYELAT